MAHWSSHCRTNRRPVSSLVVVLLLLLQCTHPCHGLFFELFAGECAGSDLRCGFFNWGYQLRIGIDFTASCQEVCSYAPILYDSATSECGLTCGPVAPTTPAPVVPTVPTPAPVARPPTSDPYDVTLGMDGVPVLDRSRFRAAAARWERIVTQGLSDIANADFPDPPRYASCSYPASGFVDDLYICAEYVTRDGEGGVLGFASTGFRRSVDGLPITGTMAFDTADVNRLKTNSDFDFVLTHEIGHLLGKY